MSDQITLHEFAASGNCYKIRLLLAHLGQQYTRIEYNILKGETRTPEYLANINPNGRIPVLQIGNRFLPESNAALFYLAQGTRLEPADPFNRADVLRWLFWEQYNHEPNIATLRYWATYGGGYDAQSPAAQAQIPAKRAAGEAALRLMDDHLATHRWLAADQMTIADIALYAYTHVAADGGFDLAAHANLTRWLEEIASISGHVPLEA